jgi:hypothetical protein
MLSNLLDGVSNGKPNWDSFKNEDVFEKYTSDKIEGLVTTFLDEIYLVGFRILALLGLT